MSGRGGRWFVGSRVNGPRWVAVGSYVAYVCGRGDTSREHFGRTAGIGNALKQRIDDSGKSEKLLKSPERIESGKSAAAEGAPLCVRRVA